MAAWGGVILPLLSGGEKKGDSRASWMSVAVFLLLTGCFLLLFWYHWKIFRALPLELPDRVGTWINQQLAGRGGGSLGSVDWSNPPRFAIPFWIEAEKLFFWTYILSLVTFLEERRAHFGYRMTLRILLALQVTGMALFSNPLLEPLPKFHQEISAWFGGGIMEQVRYFFQIYPRMKFYYNASYMWIHPPMLFVAYATLTATFAASLFTLRRSDPALDRSAYGYARIGYILLTVGMLRAIRGPSSPGDPTGGGIPR
jgi:hypothetical protein